MDNTQEMVLAREKLCPQAPRKIHVTAQPVTAKQVEKQLRAQADPVKAEFFPRFFKAGPGQYAEGDQFLGVVVPKQRKLARQFQDLPRSEILLLLQSPFHECRLTGWLILVRQFQRSKQSKEKQQAFRFYVKHIDCANNWDLVDSTASYIAGAWCWETEDDQVLRKWLSSGKLWRQRAAMVATYYFIKQGHLETTLEFALALLNHPHDLIHKATGWMLREAGKQDVDRLHQFLDVHAPQMPRTMLRYSLEKLAPAEKKKYLAK